LSVNSWTSFHNSFRNCSGAFSMLSSVFIHFAVV
jgi:hypothetical protein